VTFLSAISYEMIALPARAPQASSLVLSGGPMRFPRALARPLCPGPGNASVGLTVVDTAEDALYVCLARGWRAVTATTLTTRAPVTPAFTGTADALLVPAGCSEAWVYAWGGGGAGAGATGSTGGGGAYVRARVPVVGGETLTVVVGGGGNKKAGDSSHGSGGAGYSGLFRGSVSQANALVVAGGGGGTLHCSGGGGGGAPNGLDGITGATAGGCGTSQPYSGRGGSTTAGGAAGYHVSGAAPGAGAALSGGTGGDGSGGYSPVAFGGGAGGGIGGGGGGGYWGGGGGGHHGGVSAGGGGGGSSFATTEAIVGSVLMEAGGVGTPGGTASPQYGASAGVGATNWNNGNNGRVVLQWVCVGQ
jgi:hypothetical protein